MVRHRGKFKPESLLPYELSRGKIENFMKCRACFWLDRVKGVHFPSIPGFNLNSNTDILLKRDMNKFRGREAHPVFAKNGLPHLIPFAHGDLEKWTSSLHFGLSPQHLNTVHEITNICVGGGLDDVLLNTETKELHIVDFKSTANLSKQPKPVDLHGKWKLSYKRQMDIYQWIMRRKGFSVSDIGYFLYVDGQHLNVDGMIDLENPSKAYMSFNTSLLEYQGSEHWIEKTLRDIKGVLTSSFSPSHSEDCEQGRFLQEVSSVTGQLSLL